MTNIGTKLNIEHWL